MTNLFEVASGSIVGTDHIGASQILVGKNNQDSLWVSTGPEYLVAVVCDGCGKGEHSETGAQLGARILSVKLSELAQRWAGTDFKKMSGCIAQALERAKQDTLAQLRVLALSMGDSLSEVVQDYFLFTVMATVITPCWTVIFSRGDGVFGLNEHVEILDSGENNEPAYLSYNLTGSALVENNPELLNFEVQRFLRTENVSKILIASDGAAEFEKISGKNVPGKQELAGRLEQFFDDRYFSNPCSLKGRLVLLNSRKILLGKTGNGLETEHGLLHDDTSIVVIRRKAAKERTTACTEK